ncbi:MAG: DNA polymerase III subunit beta [Candidatus Omnitrophica bacterium]|nr:DNA polymerase III subunit beta [Candidatus Omnitrophota bacterium]MBI3021095.1 DNA polymerase III subunit beta [Candidatus Omnitrophota bacterium]
MRLTIPQPQLLKTLQSVEHAVNDRSTLPILANVLLETNEHELTLTATDLDVGIQCRFPLTPPVEHGAVALPARKLTTIVRELPEEPITLEARKNHTATISCGPSSFRVPGLPAEDFPVLPQQQHEDRVTVAQGVLKALIAQTAYAMSMEETRFILNGALLAAQKSELVIVATDGRRLAVAHGTLNEPARRPLQVVMPAKTVRELGRLLQEETDEVTIAPLKDNQLTFRFGAVTVVTRLIEGQFPQYEKVIPPPSKHDFSCNRQALINAIRRASLMTTATSQAITFELNANRLIISKESSELGSAHEELDVAYVGEPMVAAFNPEFWLDVLKVLETNEVAIEVAGPDRPAVIRQPEFTYIVLPMKVA